MKVITKIIELLGWSMIFLGVLLFVMEDQQEYKQEPTQQITKVLSREHLCLMEMLWFEGRGLPALEKEAILDVAINRSKSNKYPSDLCQVVQQPWQYSYRNNIKVKDRIILPEFQSLISKSEQAAYIEIEEIVTNRLNSSELSSVVLPDTAMWYHTKAINKPYWARSKNIKEVTKDVDKGFLHKYYAVID